MGAFDLQTLAATRQPHLKMGKYVNFKSTRRSHIWWVYSLVRFQQSSYSIFESLPLFKIITRLNRTSCSLRVRAFIYIPSIGARNAPKLGRCQFNSPLQSRTIFCLFHFWDCCVGEIPLSYVSLHVARFEGDLGGGGGEAGTGRPWVATASRAPHATAPVKQTRGWESMLIYSCCAS